MLKKLGFPVIALAAMLTFFTPTAAQAKSHWHFGVGIGGPVYTYPGYVAPYPYDYGYTPYFDPYYAFGWGWSGHDHHVDGGVHGHSGGFYGGSHGHGRR